jgi:hypothetical protein
MRKYSAKPSWCSRKVGNREGLGRQCDGSCLGCATHHECEQDRPLEPTDVPTSVFESGPRLVFLFEFRGERRQHPGDEASSKKDAGKQSRPPSRAPREEANGGYAARGQARRPRRSRRQRQSGGGASRVRGPSKAIALPREAQSRCALAHRAPRSPRADAIIRSARCRPAISSWTPAFKRRFEAACWVIPRALPIRTVEAPVIAISTARQRSRP